MLLTFILSKEGKRQYADKWKVASDRNPRNLSKRVRFRRNLSCLMLTCVYRVTSKQRGSLKKSDPVVVIRYKVVSFARNETKSVRWNEIIRSCIEKSHSFIVSCTTHFLSFFLSFLQHFFPSVFFFFSEFTT